MWPFGRRRPDDLGRRGEDLARRFLRRRGMKVLGRNYRCPAGEVDLIVLDRSTRTTHGAETIVFVEVKTRNSDHYTDPASAVDAEKRRRVKKAAHYYLARRDVEGYNVRYDVVSVVVPAGQEPRVRHIADAF